MATLRRRARPNQLSHIRMQEQFDIVMTDNRLSLLLKHSIMAEKIHIVLSVIIEWMA
jgi:hypothetical protein